jgi:hypothetical protein
MDDTRYFHDITMAAGSMDETYKLLYCNKQADNQSDNATVEKIDYNAYCLTEFIDWTGCTYTSTTVLEKRHTDTLTHCHTEIYQPPSKAS